MRDISTTPVEIAAHYKHLAALGREEFLAAAPPAVLVRFRSVDASTFPLETTATIDQEVAMTDETMPHGRHDLAADLEIYPLLKKPGASFPDRITVGRTPNNDVVLADASISRLHAYLRQQGSGWVVADAGSKNGSWLRGETLTARKERPLASREILRFGDVDLTFYVASDLFTILGGVG